MNFANTWNNLLKYWISSEFLQVEDYVQGTLRKLLYSHCSFQRALKNNYFGKVSLMVFIDSLNKISKHCFFVDTLLIEGCIQGTPRNELLIASFLGYFQATTLRKSY